MQNVRKNKTIQQDKLRSLQTCYLANILQDYYDNLGKHKVRDSFLNARTLFLVCEIDMLMLSQHFVFFVYELVLQDLQGLNGPYKNKNISYTWHECLYCSQSPFGRFTDKTSGPLGKVLRSTQYT